MTDAPIPRKVIENPVKHRSRTFPGIAAAMADQWPGLTHNAKLTGAQQRAVDAE